MVEAHGTLATKGMSRSSGMSDFFTNDFSIDKTSQGINKVRKIT